MKGLNVMLVDGDGLLYRVACSTGCTSAEEAEAGIDRCIRMLQRRLRAKKVIIHLSSLFKEVNRRYAIAVTQPYKGNRSLKQRPFYWNYLYNYLLDNYHCEVATIDEADDSLGIALMSYKGKEAVAVSIDKDLLQVPGLHYNQLHNVLVTSSDPGDLLIKPNNRLTGYGFKWFCAQMLLGDSCDNIKGIKGLGDIRTYKLLNPLETEEECWELVQSIYEDEKPHRLKENAQLLWISRKPNQRIPTIRDVSLWEEDDA